MPWPRAIMFGPRVPCAFRSVCGWIRLAMSIAGRLFEPCVIGVVLAVVMGMLSSSCGLARGAAPARRRACIVLLHQRDGARRVALLDVCEQTIVLGYRRRRVAGHREIRLPH